MRFVLDTNVVISALLWNGSPRQLLGLIRKTGFGLPTCPELMDELARVLAYPKFHQRIIRSNTDINVICKNYRGFVQEIYVPKPIRNVCRDLTDDIILACAVAANADLIVTGDSDLLVMRQYQNIPIVQVPKALQTLRNSVFRSGIP